MRRLLPVAAVLILPLALTFCNDNDNDFVPVGDGAVEIRDDCDSASFNAGLGAGTCTKAGTTTLAAFNSELTANGSVAAWQFVPNRFTITTGGRIVAFNAGGEHHTFTEVANFGGGSVPALNALAGTPVEAPECVNASQNALIAPGQSFTTDAATETGTENYQCCIHPWMRAIVTVIGR